MRLKASIAAFFIIIAVTLVSAGLLNAPLTYDGSYYLFRALDDGQPFVPNHREVHALLEAPALALRDTTENLPLLERVFSLTYTVIPLIALLCAWQIVKGRAPQMFVWAALGICIATLPGQIGFIVEGAMVVQLMWSLWLACLLGVRRRDLPILIPIGVVTFISHPTAFVLFLIGAGLAAVAGWRARQRSALYVAALLVIVAVLAFIRSATLLNPYEQEQLSLALTYQRFLSSVLGFQLGGLLVAYLIGAKVARLPLPQVVSRVSMNRLIVVLAALFLLWAIVPRLWFDTLSYRFFVIPATLPFVTFAAWDKLQNRDVSASMQDRIGWVLRIGGVFALVIGLQSAIWFAFTLRLSQTVDDSAETTIVFQDSANDWMHNTVLSHWATVPLSILLQGRQPDTWVIWDPMQTEDTDRGLWVTTWYLRPSNGKWFDLDVLRARIAAAS